MATTPGLGLQLLKEASLANAGLAGHLQDTTCALVAEGIEGSFDGFQFRIPPDQYRRGPAHHAHPHRRPRLIVGASSGPS